MYLMSLAKHKSIETRSTTVIFEFLKTSKNSVSYIYIKKKKTKLKKVKVFYKICEALMYLAQGKRENILIMFFQKPIR